MPSSAGVAAKKAPIRQFSSRVALTWYMTQSSSYLYLPSTLPTTAKALQNTGRAEMR
jgi:hypothetical protein